MARPSDARRLTREAYPHVLKEGHTTTVTTIKAAIRSLHPELGATWNPSNITIATELEAINREFGERLLTSAPVSDSDLPEGVVRGLNALGFDLWACAVKEAATTFDEERSALTERIKTLEEAFCTSENEVNALKQQTIVDRASHGDEVATLRASIEENLARCSQLEDALRSAMTEHSRTKALLQESERVQSNTAAELAELTRKAASDATLAAERYDGLIKTTAAQIDGVRQSRNDALKEAKEWKAASERREAELAVANVALRDMAAKLGEAHGQVRILTEHLERRVDAAEGLERRHTQLATKLAAVRDALKRLLSAKVSTKTTADSILEKVKGIVDGL